MAARIARFPRIDFRGFPWIYFRGFPALFAQQTKTPAGRRRRGHGGTPGAAAAFCSIFLWFGLFCFLKHPKSRGFRPQILLPRPKSAAGIWGAAPERSRNSLPWGVLNAGINRGKSGFSHPGRGFGVKPPERGNCGIVGSPKLFSRFSFPSPSQIPALSPPGFSPEYSGAGSELAPTGTGILGEFSGLLGNSRGFGGILRVLGKFSGFREVLGADLQRCREKRGAGGVWE